MASEDWREAAEKRLKQEWGDIREVGAEKLRAQIIGAYALLVVALIARMVKGVIYGGGLLPSRAILLAAIVGIPAILNLSSLVQRWEEAHRIQAERMIRLEMTLDSLMKKHAVSDEGVR
jgi:hypothetical protein